MTAEQFAYWLQGYAELSDSPPTAEQWSLIREHLALVFDKVTSTPRWQDQPTFVWPQEMPRYDIKPTITCSLPGDDTQTRAVC